MKKLLYTFFFGYAAFKWRRLIRTISIIIASPFLLYNTSKLIFDSSLSYWPDEALPLILVVFMSILLSWVIKSFIVKEDK